MKKMYERGNLVSLPPILFKSIQFSDVKYQIAPVEDQQAIFQGYCTLLDSCDDRTHLTITLKKSEWNKRNLKSNCSIKKQGRDRTFTVEN